MCIRDRRFLGRAVHLADAQAGQQLAGAGLQHGRAAGGHLDVAGIVAAAGRGAMAMVVGLLPAVIVVVAVIVAVIMRMRRSMIVALAVRVRMAMIVVMPMVMSAGLGRGLGAAAGARLPRRGVIGMFVRCARHSGCLFVSR